MSAERNIHNLANRCWEGDRPVLQQVDNHVCEAIRQHLEELPHVINRAACRGLQCSDLEIAKGVKASETVQHLMSLQSQGLFFLELRACMHQGGVMAERLHQSIQGAVVDTLRYSRLEALWQRDRQQRFPNAGAHVRAEFKRATRELIRRIDANPRRGIRYMLRRDNDENRFAAPPYFIPQQTLRPCVTPISSIQRRWPGGGPGPIRSRCRRSTSQTTCGRVTRTLRWMAAWEPRATTHYGETCPAHGRAEATEVQATQAQRIMTGQLGEALAMRAQTMTFPVDDVVSRSEEEILPRVTNERIKIMNLVKLFTTVLFVRRSPVHFRSERSDPGRSNTPKPAGVNAGIQTWLISPGVAMHLVQ